MPSFGSSSEKQLATCDERLVKVLREAIKYIDFSVVEGFRNEASQHKAYVDGFSKLDWPHGKHNHNPSYAADCYPYPVDFSDSPANMERFARLAGVIDVVSKQLGVSIRWGGDWNNDQDERDEGKFRDHPHFELRNP